MDYNVLFAFAEIRIDELRREAQEARLSAKLPPTTRTAWRSAAARRLRAFADWLEPRIDVAPRAEPLRAL